MKIKKLILVILVGFLSLHAQDQKADISFIKRQYSNFKKDLSLVKKCYFVRSASCSVKEVQEARSAAFRVVMEGAALAALIYGVYRMSKLGNYNLPTGTKPNIDISNGNGNKDDDLTIFVKKELGSDFNQERLDAIKKFENAENRDAQYRHLIGILDPKNLDFARKIKWKNAHIFNKFFNLPEQVAKRDEAQRAAIEAQYRLEHDRMQEQYNAKKNRLSPVGQAIVDILQDGGNINRYSDIKDSLLDEGRYDLAAFKIGANYLKNGIKIPEEDEKAEPLIDKIERIAKLTKEEIEQRKAFYDFKKNSNISYLLMEDRTRPEYFDSDLVELYKNIYDWALRVKIKLNL